MVYNEDKMIKLVHQDKYLWFVFKDLLERNDNDRKTVLRVLFNANVLDGDYKRAYDALEGK